MGDMDGEADCLAQGRMRMMDGAADDGGVVTAADRQGDPPITLLDQIPGKCH